MNNGFCALRENCLLKHFNNLLFIPVRNDCLALCTIMEFILKSERFIKKIQKIYYCIFSKMFVDMCEIYRFRILVLFPYNVSEFPAYYIELVPLY